MAQMASGADFAKGTFKVPNSGTYTLNFGKTFNKYLYIVEMTDDSKTDLINTGVNASRSFAVIGVYPSMKIDNTDGYSDLVSRINPSTKALSENHMGNVVHTTSSIQFPVGSTASANYLYYEYSYNYYIVEMK